MWPSWHHSSMGGTFFYVLNWYWLIVRGAFLQRQVCHIFSMIWNIKGLPLCVLYIIPGRSHSAKRVSGLSSCQDSGDIQPPFICTDKYHCFALDRIISWAPPGVALLLYFACALLISIGPHQLWIFFHSAILPIFGDPLLLPKGSFESFIWGVYVSGISMSLAYLCVF